MVVEGVGDSARPVVPPAVAAAALVAPSVGLGRWAAEPGALAALPAATGSGAARGDRPGPADGTVCAAPLCPRGFTRELSVSLPELKHEGERLNPAISFKREHSCFSYLCS